MIGGTLGDTFIHWNSKHSSFKGAGRYGCLLGGFFVQPVAGGRRHIYIWVCFMSWLSSIFLSRFSSPWAVSRVAEAGFVQWIPFFHLLSPVDPTKVLAKELCRGVGTDQTFWALSFGAAVKEGNPKLAKESCTLLSSSHATLDFNTIWWRFLAQHPNFSYLLVYLCIKSNWPMWAEYIEYETWAASRL